ncbi:MAG: hypothetical protein GVY29_09515 [Spirochaetes bacterium]|nr:hypothetical protein [Spirochaetota bacterium]
MKREDFIFTIGYQGSSAVVDAGARKKYGKLGTMELAKKGLLKQAFLSALYSGDGEETRELIAYFQANTSIEADSVAALKRLFGVSEVPEGITKTVQV